VVGGPGSVLGSMEGFPEEVAFKLKSKGQVQVIQEIKERSGILIPANTQGCKTFQCVDLSCHSPLPHLLLCLATSCLGFSHVVNIH
jgi:hypothetical protein